MPHATRLRGAYPSVPLLPPPLAVLAAPLLLLLAFGSCRAQLEACPGYSEQGQDAARLVYKAMIPPEHLEDVFTPQRFSELLGQLVDGLPLEVLSVDT